MDMQQAKMLKNDLEQAITKLVRDFEIQTSLQVENIRLRKNEALGKRPETYKTDVVTIFE